MPQAIVYDKDAALRQGIIGAGSALGSALGYNAQQERQQQQQLEQRQRQQGAMNAVLEWAQNIPEGEDMVNSLGTLQQTLQGMDVDPATIQPIIQDVIKQSAQQRLKPPAKPEVTPFGKKMQEAGAEFLSETMLNIPKVAESRKNIERMRELAKNLRGVSGYAKAAWGSQDATEFNALGLTAIEPVLKVLNPRGVIPQRKIEMIRDLYSPKASDNRWAIEGKIKALESFTESAEELGQVMGALYQMYGENIPMEALTQYEALASGLVDRTLSNRGASDVNNDGQPDIQSFDRPTAQMARDNKGRIITNQKTGEKLISNGSRWVKYEGK